MTLVYIIYRHGIAMKTSKMALYIILLPIAVIVVASSLFLAIFDANDYKQELVDYVKESSGRSLVFKGDAELMLYPDFGMKLGAMQFSNAPGFGAKPMLSVDEVSISVDVKSVLMLQPKVSQLILSELHIDLQKNKQGVSNWDDLLPEKAKQESSTSVSKDDTKAVESEKSDFEIAGAFDGIDINNAQVSWRDATTGESISIDDLDFTTGKITPTEPFPLSLQLLMHQKKDINAAINFETQVFFNQKTKTLTLEQLDLNLRAHGDLVPVDQSDVSIKGDVNFDLDKQLLKISKLMLQAQTEGGVMQKTDTQISGELAMDLNTQHLTIAQLDMNADIQDASMPKGQLKAAIKSQQLDVRLNQRKVTLSRLQLGINKVLFNGDIHVKDYAQPAVTFQLDAQEVDLDELLGLTDKKAEETVVETAQANTPEESEIALPIELLRSLELDGKITIGKLKAMNVLTNNNKINVSAKKGLIQMSPLSLNLYEGGLTQKLTLDVKGDTPKYTVKTNLDQVQIGDLLIDFMQLDKIRGAATIAVDVTTEGSWVNKLKSNLNGDVSLRFADGALKGLNIRHIMDVAKAKLSGGDKPKEETQETDFTELKLSGKMTNGVFSSDDLSLKSPLVRVGGEGKADLNKNEVDYTVNAKIIASLEGQTGEGMEATGLLVPVRIFGPFTAPKTDILLDNMLKQKAQQKLNASKAAIQKQKDAAAKALKESQAKLKAENDAKLEAEKLEAKAKLAAEKKQQKAELEAKKKAEKEKVKKKAKEKLKGLF